MDPCLSGVMCHMLCFMFHSTRSHVKWHHYSKTVWASDLKSETIFTTPCVSYVTCHVSIVNCKSRTFLKTKHFFFSIKKINRVSRTIRTVWELGRLIWRIETTLLQSKGVLFTQQCGSHCLYAQILSDNWNHLVGQLETSCHRVQSPESRVKWKKSRVKSQESRVKS